MNAHTRMYMHVGVQLFVLHSIHIILKVFKHCIHIYVLEHTNIHKTKSVRQEVQQCVLTIRIIVIHRFVVRRNGCD